MLSVRIELVSAQIALPVFQAIQKRVASHPGFSVTALSFGNDDQNGTGGVRRSTWVLAIGAPNIDPKRLTQLGIQI